MKLLFNIRMEQVSLNRYYKLNRILLSMIGLWPYQSARTALICRVFIGFLLIYSIFTQICAIYTSELTMDFIIDVIPSFVLLIGLIFQFANRITNHEQVKYLFDRIRLYWNRKRPQEEIKIMQLYLESTRTLTLRLTTYSNLGLVAFIFVINLPQILDVFVPLNESRSHEQPMKVELLINKEKYFYVIRFYICFMIVLVLETGLATGTLLLVYIQHACGMFAVLGHQSERIFSSDKPSSSKTRFIDASKSDYASIILFVEDHRNAIQFTDVIRSCYNVSLFVESLMLILTITFELVQIVTALEMSERVLKCLVASSVQFTYIVMCNYIGQRLIDASKQIPIKICCGNWYNIPVWKQKLMLFIMMKCTRPISITIFDVYVMCLETLSMIMQMILSLCMLIRQL